MKIQGHLAGGWLITRTIVNSMACSKSQRRKLLVFGSIAGTLPDWDYLFYAIKKGGIAYSNDFRHHTWITHTFPFYWSIASLIYLLGVIQKNKTTKDSAVVLAASTSIHLLQDAIGSGDGIMFFYPVSKKMNGVALIGLHGNEWEAKYVSSPIFRLELFLRILGILTFVYDLIKRRI